MASSIEQKNQPDGLEKENLRKPTDSDLVCGDICAKCSRAFSPLGCFGCGIYNERARRDAQISLTGHRRSEGKCFEPQ